MLLNPGKLLQGGEVQTYQNDSLSNSTFFQRDMLKEEKEEKEEALKNWSLPFWRSLSPLTDNVRMQNTRGGFDKR